MIVSRVTLIVLVICLASPLRGAEPAFRPALVGSGPRSLANLIDVKKLLSKGEPDGVVTFTRGVFPPGKGRDFAEIGRVTPGSRHLGSEVLRALQKSRFVPAIAQGKPEAVYFRGTVLFFAHSQPHLRVLANQDPSALAHFDDFIAPQEIFGTARSLENDQRLDAFQRRFKGGAVTLELRVSAQGKVMSSRVLSEEPRGYNLGVCEADALANAAFIPGFRNGQPSECSFQMTRHLGFVSPSDYGRY